MARTWTRLAPLVASVALACGEPADPGQEIDTTADEDDETRFAPRFNHLAENEMAADRIEDNFLNVEFVYVGLTSLLIDDASVGTLSSPGRVGQLFGDTLQLNLHGGLVAGRHSLQLYTPGTARGLFSQPITIRVRSWATLQPTATLDPTGLAGIVDLEAWGHGEQAGIVALENGPAAVAHLLPIRNGDVQTDQAMAVDLPGFGHHPSQTRVAVETHGPTAHIAWTVGRPGTGVHVREVNLENHELGPAVPALGLDATLVGSAQWSEFGRPVLADDILLVEFRAHLDVEQPAPGERSLVSVRLRPGPTLGRPHRLNVAGPMDLDGLGPALELADLRLDRPPTTFAVRVDQLRAAIVEVKPDDGTLSLVPSPVAANDVGLPELTGDVRAIRGAFGSRTTFARGAFGLSVFLVDDSSDNGVTAPAPELPELPPTGPVAFGVLAGNPVLVVPYGNAANVWVAASNGATLNTVELAGIACDRVALTPHLDGNTDGQVPLACLRDGELHTGHLFRAGAGP